MQSKLRRMICMLGLALTMGLAVMVHMALSRAPQIVRADEGVFYVDDDVCPGTGSGTRSDPFCRIQDAVDAANANDEIRVAGGTYTGTESVLDARTGYTYTQVVFVPISLTLRGGYEATDWDAAPDPTSHPTVIDAQRSGRGISIVGKDVGTESLWVTLDGFTITGGDYTGLGSPSDANNQTCAITNQDCGGGLYAFRCRLSLLNSIVSDNIASRDQGYGGGLYIWKVQNTPGIHIENTTILSNSAESGSGIYVAKPWGSPLTIAGSTIQENTSSGAYGSVVMQTVYGPLTITETRFISNTAVNGTSAAAYLYLGNKGHLQMDRVRFENNRAQEYAVLNVYGYFNPCSARLTNVLFAGNRLDSSDANDAVLHIYSYATSFDVALSHVTAADNQAATFLHADINGADHTLTVTVTNALVSDATHAFSGRELSGEMTIKHTRTLTYNVTTLHHTMAGTPTFEAVDTQAGNPRLDATYHLQSGSAAIDAGVDAGVMVDLDGDPRPQNKAPDIGADEAPCWIYLPLVIR